MLYHKASIVTALLPMICRSFAAEPVEENADQTVRQGSGRGQTIPVGLGDASIKTVDIDDGFNVTDGTGMSLLSYKWPSHLYAIHVRPIECFPIKSLPVHSAILYARTYCSSQKITRPSQLINTTNAPRSKRKFSNKQPTTRSISLTLG